MLFVGISLLAVKLFHRQMLLLVSNDGKTLPDEYAPTPPDPRGVEAGAKAASDDESTGAARESVPPATGESGDGEKKSEGKGKNYAPGVSYLGNRVMAITTLAFVFLLAFALSNFWGNNQAAQTAIQEETSTYGRALAGAMTLPADQGGATIVAGLASYANSVLDGEWPALRDADQARASEIHSAASLKLAEAVVAAQELGADKSSSWDLITNSIDSLVSSGFDRINQLPSSNASNVVILLILLGIVNLAITMTFQPTRRGPQYFLVAVMAAITAFLLFFVIEAANPFLGSDALRPPNFELMSQ